MVRPSHQTQNYYPLFCVLSFDDCNNMIEIREQSNYKLRLTRYLLMISGIRKIVDIFKEVFPSNCVCSISND